MGRRGREKGAPIARGRVAQLKMAARSAADSHVSLRYRPATPPPLVESPVPTGGVASGSLSATGVPRGQSRKGGRRVWRPALPAVRT